MQIVDDEYHDPAIGLQPVEKIEQPGPHGHRIGPGLGWWSKPQLVDDAVGQRRLGLVTTGLQNDGVGERPEEPRQQGRFSRPGLGLDTHHLRMARLGRSELLVEDSQFVLPPDEADWGAHRISLNALRTLPSPAPR